MTVIIKSFLPTSCLRETNWTISSERACLVFLKSVHSVARVYETVLPFSLAQESGSLVRFNWPLPSISSVWVYWTAGKHSSTYLVVQQPCPYVRSLYSSTPTWAERLTRHSLVTAMAISFASPTNLDLIKRCGSAMRLSHLREFSFLSLGLKNTWPTEVSGWVMLASFISTLPQDYSVSW